MGEDAAIDERLAADTAALVRAKLGADMRDIAPLPGHAGLGFSFHAGPRRYVIRTIAEGVPATGPADVVRQGGIMRSLAPHGVPVPEIVVCEAATPPFNRPYFIAAFVEGTATVNPDFRTQTEKDRTLARAGMAALAKLHAVEARAVEAVWGPPRSLADELDRLLKLYDRPTIDPAWGGRAPLLREKLLASLPDETAPGCVHGDYHWGNLIFGDADVRAIVDWEIAFVGATLLDVGWLAFYADPESFVGDWQDRAKRFALDSEELIDAYEAAAGRTVSRAQTDWFRAFSAYRFGVITLFNLMLHRRGKRHDPLWEETAKSAPQMIERGLELLG